MRVEEKHIPVYRQFITELEKGFRMLDNQGQEEIITFIRSQQHKEGLFTDRAGYPDLYYSLFGTWLAKALKLDDVLLRLRNNAALKIKENHKIIDRFSLLLIRISVNSEYRKPSLFGLLFPVYAKGKNINATYRSFLFMLTYDALYGESRFIYNSLKIIMRFYKPRGELPCSFMAAILMVRHLTGIERKKETGLLMEYYEKSKGFKIFPEQEHADLLSTAVALFALKKSGADLRLTAPDCLELVHSNYSNGAFLPGGVDKARDLEYTFYGLLTLGILSHDG